MEGSRWFENIELKTEKIIYITVAKYESFFNIWQGATHKMHHVRLAGWRCSCMWIKRSQPDSICAMLLALVLMVYVLSPIWIGPEAAHWYSKGKHTDFGPLWRGSGSSRPWHCSNTVAGAVSETEVENKLERAGAGEATIRSSSG